MGNTHPVLSGAGLIRNATICFIAFNEIRTLPELHGDTHAHFDAPCVYTPDELPILTAHEMPHIEAALSAEINEFDRLKSRFEAPQKSLDVDTIPHTASYASTGKPTKLAPDSCCNFLYSCRFTDPIFFLSVKTSLPYTVLFSHE